MSPSSSLEVLDSALPDLLEHRASLLLKFYAERNSAGNEFIPKRPKQSRERWFLVEAGWFSRLKHGAGSPDATETWFRCQDPGPLDNSKLIDPKTSRLRERLVEGFNYVAVSEGFWINIKSWYRVVGPEIMRCGTSRGDIEVYPPAFRISFSTDPQGEWDSSKEFQMEFSHDMTVLEVFNVLKERFGEPSIVVSRSSYMDFVPVRCEGTSAEATLRQLGWQTGDRLLVVVPPRAVVSTLSTMSSSVSSASVTIGPSISHNPVASWSTITSNRGDAAGTKQVDGLCGLLNLGNTCYLNSVLQCLSHTTPLRTQVIPGKAMRMVNPESKFGRKGEVVKEVTDLFREMWSGRNKTVAPHGMKAALDRWTTMFRGYQQQDAHEALVFLLDALHEDTNFNDRVNKPSLMEKINMGVFQSKVSCPVCGTESISSEGFQVISLDMPNESVSLQPVARTSSAVDIVVIPSSGQKLRRVTVSKENVDTVDALRSRLQHASGASNLVLARMRKDLQSVPNFNTVEVLSAHLKLEVAIPLGWELVAFEIEDSEIRNTGVEFVYGVHRNSHQKFVGLPFVVAVKRTETKRELVQKVEHRFGNSSSQYTIKTAFRSKGDLIRDFTCDDTLCNSQLKYGAQVLVLEWQSEAPAVAEQSLSSNPVMDSLETERLQSSVGTSPTGQSIQERLNAFCAAEVLGQEDLWSCEKCKEKRAAKKQISIAEPNPEILILHLKRFNSLGAKLSTSISFAPFLQLNNSNYELYGVIRHHGATITGGHYDALVKASLDNSWYRCNDSQITTIPNLQVGKAKLPGIVWNDPTAYIFFFRKKVVSAAL